MLDAAIRPTSLPGVLVYALPEAFEDLTKGCLMRLFHCSAIGTLSSLSEARSLHAGLTTIACPAEVHCRSCKGSRHLLRVHEQRRTVPGHSSGQPFALKYAGSWQLS